MNWLEYVQTILDFQLFQLGGNPITVLHVTMSVFSLIVTYILARSVHRILSRYVLKEVDPAPRYVIVRFTQYLVWLIGIAVAIELLNVDLTALTFVAGALGIGIGFGLQNVVNNLVSGVVLLLEQPVRYRDRVSVENVEGQVEHINFRSTTIITNDNITIIVPNSQLINQAVINWSHGDPRIRVHVPVGVAYGSDVDLVDRNVAGGGGCTEEGPGESGARGTFSRVRRLVVELRATRMVGRAAEPSSIAQQSELRHRRRVPRKRHRDPVPPKRPAPQDAVAWRPRQRLLQVASS